MTARIIATANIVQERNDMKQRTKTAEQSCPEILLYCSLSNQVFLNIDNISRNDGRHSVTCCARARLLSRPIREQLATVAMLATN